MSNNMPPMLAYTVRSSNYSNNAPHVTVDYGSKAARFTPDNPQDNSIWILILDSMDPKKKVKEFVLPGQNNTTVPAGLHDFMYNPTCIFAVATQYLSTVNPPQGALYDFLVQFGAGRELQALEQVACVLGCGVFTRLNYILTGACGQRNQPPKPPTYEVSSLSSGALLMMSLMPTPSGKPPYSLCDTYTFKH